jgi:AbrB family looped-hinge helix DNA binding protein
MLITIDKRGSINLPAALRRQLGLEIGSYLDLRLAEGGLVVLQPVEIVRSIRLSPSGLKKISEARKSGTTKIPRWLQQDMNDADPETESEVS